MFVWMLSLFLITQVEGEGSSAENEYPPVLSRSELDEEILRARMRDFYGSVSRAAKTKWKVSAFGEKYTWTWTGENWECPQAEEPTEDQEDGQSSVIECMNWVPVSFQWWLTSNRWLDQWTEMNRIGFLLGQEKLPEKTITAKSVVYDLLEDTPASLEDEKEETQEPLEPVELGDKKPAYEVWEWIAEDGRRVKVYSSLRNQWLGRIEAPSSREYLLWEKKNRWVKPTLKTVILEKSGRRIRLDRDS